MLTSQGLLQRLWYNNNNNNSFKSVEKNFKNILLYNPQIIIQILICAFAPISRPSGFITTGKMVCQQFYLEILLWEIYNYADSLPLGPNVTFKKWLSYITCFICLLSAYLTINDMSIYFNINSLINYLYLMYELEIICIICSFCIWFSFFLFPYNLLSA